MIDMGEEEIWRKDSCVNTRGMLSASRVKSVFARLVRAAIKELGYDERYASIYKIFGLQKRSFCHFLAEKNCGTLQLRGGVDISIWVCKGILVIIILFEILHQINTGNFSS